MQQLAYTLLRCNEFEETEAEKYFEELSVEAQNPKVVAIGECG